MSRARMTMRAEVERSTAAGTDPFGGPVPKVFSPLATLACWVWSTQSREAVDENKTALVEDLRAMFPTGADIQQGDEIVKVKDRQGTEVIPGRLRVVAPLQFKHNHIEAVLERVQ